MKDASATTLPYGEPIPERPLDLLLAGAVLASATLAAIAGIAYHAWYLRDMPDNTAILISGLLFFVYAGGVYVFSYGWERRDVERAVRLTFVIVVLSAVAFLLLVLVTRLRGGSGSKSSREGSGVSLARGRCG